MADQVGSIANGQRAVLIVVDGDPLAHIEDVTHVLTSVRTDVMLDAAAVGGSVSLSPLAAR
jgi:imidazolonepropionase-like amidohydrolase